MVSDKSVVGIVPAHGSDFGGSMDFPDFLLPLEPNFTLLENSIIECAAAGVNSIWVICDNDEIPLVKWRLGEWVLDPAFSMNFEKARKIPIFYIPVKENNIDNRDTLTHNVLFGMRSVQHISDRLSVWVRPDYYYVSFPCGIYSYKDVLSVRNEITSESVIVNSSDESIKSGFQFGFTIKDDAVDDLLEQLYIVEGNLMSQYNVREKFGVALKDVLGDATMEHSEVDILEAREINDFQDYARLVNSGIAEPLEECFVREKDVGTEFCKVPFSQSSWQANEQRKVIGYDGRDVSWSMRKLSEEDVKEIKTLYSTKKITLRALAKMFEVSLMTIKRILDKRTYKEIE